MKHSLTSRLRFQQMLLLTLAILGGIRFLCAQNATVPPAEKPATMPMPQYVDILNGFSLRCPWPAVPLSNIPSTLQNQAMGKLNGHYAPHQAWQDFQNWDAVKFPAGKELVRFFPAHDKDLGCLMVYLVVTRESLGIEQLMQARLNYWNKYPRRIDMRQSTIGISNGRAAARLQLSWKKDENALPSQHIAEALVQNEKDRYFLIMLAHNNGDPCQVDAMFDLTLQTFQCLSKTEEDKRWEQAKKQGEAFLDQLNADKIASALNSITGFRIVHQGKEVGFLMLTEQFSRSGEDPSLQITMQGYLEQASQVFKLADMQGWRSSIKYSDSDMQFPGSPVWVQCTLNIAVTLKTGSFDYVLRPTNSPGMGYREQGAFSNGTLTVKRYLPIETKEPSVDTLKIVNSIYLPWSLRPLLHRLTDRKVGGEYVFMTYHDGNLCYQTLHYNADIPLTVDGATFNTIYAVAQPGVQGPIIEYWLDSKGRIVQQRCGEIMLIKDDINNLKAKWPEPFESMTAAGQPG